MSQRLRFLLPDLGEGLPDATVVEWLVQPGQKVQLDAPLVAMETAKAVVEVPSPCTGSLLSVGGEAGSVISTGHLLAEFEIDPEAPQRAAGHDTGHHHGAAGTAASADAGTVVGAMTSSDQLRSEAASAVGGVKAVPAVRALARKLGVDLAQVRPSGADGVVTLQDVKRAAAAAPPAAGPGSAAGDAAPAGVVRAALPEPEQGQAAVTASTAAAAAATRAGAGHQAAAARTALSASGQPLRTLPPGGDGFAQPTALAGMRRSMARAMATAQAEVVLTTLTDDADLHAWRGADDLTVRLLRALVAGCRAEPALNAWFDGKALTRTLHRQVDIGLAIDSPEGLFVPVLRNADSLGPAALRIAVDRLREQVLARSLAAGEFTGATIALSNFGRFAGRYATPIVLPPTVAILAAGRSRHELVAVMGGIEAHRRLPLSLSFDHRVVTGGEAARFLAAVLDDLAAAD